MSRLRIALVGLGMAVTPHARALLDLADEVEVVRAFSPSPARRAAFAERFPFPLADSLDAILADPAIDAVLVLTPPDTHRDLARACAAAGKHVLLEKPLEISTARAEALVADCRAAGVRLGVVLQHRFRPSAIRLKALLDADGLGPVVAVSAQMALWRPQGYYDEPGRGTRARDGGGVLLTQGIHTLDLMLHLAGPVATATGFAATTPVHRMETEDLACAALRFASGAHGTVFATTAAYPGFPEEILIACARGSARLRGPELLVEWQDGRREHVGAEAGRAGAGADPMAFPHDWHRAVIADFGAAIREGRDPAVSGEDALRVHRLIDAILDSSRRGAPVAP